jgi:hypothetical protein
VHLVGLYTQIK